MRRTFLITTLLCLAAPAMGAPPQSDDEIRAKLLGNWVSVPKPQNPPDNLLIRFKQAGLATAYFFKEPECKTVLFRTDVNWSVEGGVLITRYPEGYSDHDEVTDISDESVTFMSRERREPYTRVRATTCEVPSMLP